MVKNEFENFYRELNHTIQRQIRTVYPIMGIIHKVSESREYADVKTEDGIISNIPAHGFPVVGDSCIIHFINGNLEQPVIDCARRLAPPQDELEEMLVYDANNYHHNGDFNRKEEGYTGNFTIVEDEEFINTNEYCCSLQKGEYIEFTVDISECESKYFKLQAHYKGNGLIRIECYDADTGEEKKTVPENISGDIVIWASEGSRFSWNFNKEVYLRENTTHARFKISNYTDSLGDNIPKMQVGGELVEIPTAVCIDGILVYDENGDNGYYLSKDDVLNSY